MKNKRHVGLTLIELLVAMAISLVIVIAAVYTFLGTKETQRAMERNGASNETGSYAIQLLGRAILNAGFYPATVPPIPADPTQTGMYDTYPPLPADTRVVTDWANPATGWPVLAYRTAVFGCDGAKIDVATGACGAVNASAPDTLVLNYFTSDTWGSATGQRRDCTGADAGKDPVNTERKKNTGGSPPAVPHTTEDLALPPQLPLFVSNKYTLNDVKLYVDGQDISTKSLACSGNGKSPHGTADASAYQPILAGIETLKFSYGVYNATDSLLPQRFYTAAEVGGLSNVAINGVSLSPWQRVTAVKVCLTVKTLGGNTRVADKANAKRTYVNCSNEVVDQPAGETVTRFVQVFGVRNSLKQNF